LQLANWIQSLLGQAVMKNSGGVCQLYYYEKIMCAEHVTHNAESMSQGAVDFLA